MRSATLVGICALIAQPLLVAYPSDVLAAEVVDVSIAGDAGCAVRDDGALFCFGYVGVMGRDHDGALKRVANVTAKHVAVSGQHVCFINMKGAVQCAGRGDGVSVLPGSAPPEADDLPDPEAAEWRTVPDVSNAIDVATGRHHTCALTKSGDVVCWGSTYYGRVGPSNPHGGPEKVPGLGVVTELAVSGDTTCVLSADKKVRCFGELWTHEGKDVKDGEVITLAIPPASSLGIGGGFACGLSEDGLQAGCAGRAVSFTGKETENAQTLKLPAKAAKLVSGGAGLCALGESGKLWCSGELQSLLARTGELKPGAWAAYPTALRAAALSSYDVLAIGTDGALLFAGDFKGGPLPMKPVQRMAVSVQGLANVVELAAGAQHVCARLEDATLSCWGGSSEDAAVPRAIAGLDSITAIDSGGDTTCARHSSGKLSCFQTKHVANAPSERLEAPSQPAVASVAVGASHACLLDAQGGVACWGSAYDQALGYKAKEEYPEAVKKPVAIAGLSAVTQLDAGSSATCALTTSGTVRCWGRNEAGVLGNGESKKSALAADVVSLPAVTKIELGTSNACGLGKDQRAYCWGSGALAPVPWPGDANVIDVAAGETYSDAPASGACIVRATGRVECGLPGSARTIKGVEGATAVTAGRGFACALLRDKTVKCWGKRDAGQLGDGRPPITTTFEVVALP